MNAKALTLTRSDGGPFPETDTSATLTAEGVGSLGTNPTAAIVAWLKNGGRLQIDSLRIAAAGAVLLVSGTVTLSKDGYINGPIVLAYNNVDGLGKFIDALRPGNTIQITAVNSLAIGIRPPLLSIRFHGDGEATALAKLIHEAMNWTGEARMKPRQAQALALPRRMDCKIM